MRAAQCLAHRDKTLRLHNSSATAAIARKVGRKEIENAPKALETVNGEYDKLVTMPHPDGKGAGMGHGIGDRKVRGPRRCKAHRSRCVLRNDL